MGTIQGGLEAGPFARSLGSITSGKGAITRGSLTICRGAGTDLFELQSQGNVRGADGALDLAGLRVPAFGRVVACGSGRVAVLSGVVPCPSGAPVTRASFCDS